MPIVLMFVRMALAKLLTDPAVKEAVINELKGLANDTDSKWTHEAVSLVDDAWDVLPSIFGASTPSRP